MGRVTYGPRWNYRKWSFQLTRPVWGVTETAVAVIFNSQISPHTPRVGRDFAPVIGLAALCISTHTPRVGRDILVIVRRVRPPGFQLTRPVWGVTILRRLDGDGRKHFNSHAPCGA